jgi:hypothetical protein
VEIFSVAIYCSIVIFTVRVFGRLDFAFFGWNFVIKFSTQLQVCASFNKMTFSFSKIA